MGASRTYNAESDASTSMTPPPASTTSEPAGASSSTVADDPVVTWSWLGSPATPDLDHVAASLPVSM